MAIAQIQKEISPARFKYNCRLFSYNLKFTLLLLAEFKSNQIIQLGNQSLSL